jgi:hypothetical protein
MLDKAHHLFVVQAAKEISQIRLQHPAYLTPSNHFIQCRQSIVGTHTAPPAKKAWQKVLLINR